MKPLALLLALPVVSIACLALAFSPVYRAVEMPVNTPVSIYDFTRYIAAEIESSHSDSDYVTVDSMLLALRENPTCEVFVHLTGSHEDEFVAFENEVDAASAIQNNR